MQPSTTLKMMRRRRPGNVRLLLQRLFLFAALVFALLAISSRHSATVWARPAATVVEDDGILVGDQGESEEQQLVELIDQQQQQQRHQRQQQTAVKSTDNSDQQENTDTATDEEEFRYGINNNDHRQQQKQQQLSAADTFWELEPEGTATATGRRQTTSNGNARRPIWLAKREDQPQQQLNGKRHRHRQRQQQQNEVADLPLDGQAVLPLASASDFANLTNTCRGSLFKHKIREPGCLPLTVKNRFCHGSCSSFYIPRLRSKKLKATFQSCAACVPSETDLIQVRLECPDRASGELYRTVVRVKKCACRNIVLEGEDNNEENEDSNNNDINGNNPNEEEEEEEEQNLLKERSPELNVERTEKRAEERGEAAEAEN